MEVFFGHQHRKPNSPPWPLQSVPRPSTISMETISMVIEIVESDDESPDLPGSSSSDVSELESGTSGSERVAWKMRLDMLAGSGCCVKAKHKAYNLYTARSRRGAGLGTLLLCRAVWRIHPLIIVTGESKANRTGLHGPPLISKKAPVLCEALHLACTKTKDSFVYNCWNTNGPTGAVSYAKQLKCGSER